MKALRWAWAALFLFLGATAVVFNMHSRRILVVQSGPSASTSSRAFTRGIDAVLQPVARLKVRQQYMAFDAKACAGILEQLRAFDPDTVIVEGVAARGCLQAAAGRMQVVTLPDHPRDAQARSRQVLAWQRLLHDLVPSGGTLLVLRPPGPQGLADYDALVRAAQGAGLHALEWVDDGRADHSALRRLLAQAPAPAAVVVATGAGAGWQRPREPLEAGLLRALRGITDVPILAMQLDDLAPGADLVLAQAPEQRGELLAAAALERRPVSPLGALYEMAVGMRKDFLQRHTLPEFYEVSARMAGFLASADPSADDADADDAQVAAATAPRRAPAVADAD